MSTCAAPGHPSCTISCPNGCGAIYDEPNGPCRTICSGSADIPELDPQGKYSVNFNGMSAGGIKKIFGGSIPSDLTTKLKDSDTVTLSVSNVSLAELAKAIGEKL
jgi:hypothetical protein